jgi:YidC/Oxa1 family membrane protein insertase
VLVIFFAAYDRYVIAPQNAARQAALEAQKNATLAEKTASPNSALASGGDTGNLNAPLSAVADKAAPAAPNSSIEPPRALAATERVIARVKTQISELEIDDLGRVAQATLTENIFKGEDNAQLKLFDPSEVRALEVRFRDAALNQAAFKTAYAASGAEVDATVEPAMLVLTQDLGEAQVAKTFTFYPDGHFDLKISLSKPTEFYITTGFRPVASSDKMVIQGALTQLANGSIEVIAEGDAKGGESFIGARMISTFDRYYASILFNYSETFAVNFLKVNDAAPLGFIKSEKDLELGGYIGPKYVDKLRKINPELTAAVEYGFFTFLSKPLFVILEWIYSVIPNWGWAIVVFTLLVKIVLFPLSHKGMVSMSRLKDITPRIKELQERYKDDKQKLQLHLMELYKKHNANPLGGCLPLLIQIPIFFAIYRVLLNAIELKGAEWFYISDLSMKDPFFILPLLMGFTMWFQQKITPSNFTDPMQEKLFKWLPAVFTVFFLFFPAGLVLYWLINNVISIAQQWLVNASLAKSKKRENND